MMSPNIAPGTKPRLRALIWLTLADMRHEWRYAACLIIATCAVLTPLLILASLKTGIVEVWERRLLASPSSLEIVFKEHTNLDDDWFTRVRQWPETGFAVPSLYSASGTMGLQNPHDDQFIRAIDLIATAEGDPLLGENTKAPSKATDLVLSANAAAELGLSIGDTVTARISRTTAAGRQLHQQPLQLVDIVPASVYSRQAAFISVSLMVAIESYKDNRVVPLFGVTDGKAEQPVFPPFPRARIYASSLDTVVPLSSRISALGIAVYPQTAEVAKLQTVKNTLSALFSLIVSLGLLGVLLSLAANLWANIDRKRQHLALLQLLGLQKRHVALFPLLQALIVCFCALVISLLICCTSALWVQQLFAASLRAGEHAMLLKGTTITALSTLLLLAACLSAILGGRRAANIEPAEAIHGTL